MALLYGKSAFQIDRPLNFMYQTLILTATTNYILTTRQTSKSIINYSIVYHIFNYFHRFYKQCFRRAYKKQHRQYYLSYFSLTMTGLEIMDYGIVTPIYIQNTTLFTKLVLVNIKMIGFSLMFQGKLVLFIYHNYIFFLHFTLIFIDIYTESQEIKLIKQPHGMLYLNLVMY